MMVAPSRPILRYHGGKWKLAEWVGEHFPAHRVYVESFGGGASVLLRKPRSYAEVYNELDGEITALFDVLRDPASSAHLEQACRLTPFSRIEFVRSYEKASDPVEQARRTLFRSFAGFGSTGASGGKTGFRSNVTRSGTTPADDWADFPRHIATFADRLRGVVVENRPAAEVISQFDGPDTLHYVDPPYVLSTRTETAKWDHIYRHEMTDEQHVELAATLHAATGYVVLSGYPSPLYDRLYAGWTMEVRAARGDSACERMEALWLNPKCSAARRGTFRFERGLA